MSISVIVVEDLNFRIGWEFCQPISYEAGFEVHVVVGWSLMKRIIHVFAIYIYIYKYINLYMDL